MTIAQDFGRHNWMQHLDDSRTIASLSIPGAHDAATGEGVHMVAGFGKTQELSLAALWDCGVRAFDLRPAVNGEELHIYHGPIRTKISFGKARCFKIFALCTVGGIKDYYGIWYCQYHRHTEQRS